MGKRDCNFIYLYLLCFWYLFLHHEISLFLHGEISRVIFMRRAVLDRGEDYSCPLGSLAGAQRDPGWVKNFCKIWVFFSCCFCRSKCPPVHLLYLLLLRVVLGVLAQVVLKIKICQKYFLYILIGKNGVRLILILISGEKAWCTPSRYVHSLLPPSDNL